MRSVCLPGLLALLALQLSCDILAASKTEGAVLDALKADSRTAEFQFEASIAPDGSVTVTGEVDSDLALGAVPEIVAKVPGVKQVINNCHVKETGSGMIQDETVPML